MELHCRRQFPLLSVVIPALNEEKLIGDCLRSIREQDYAGEYEIVVVDNGSTDGTAAVAGRYAARVVTFTAERNVFAARNAGAFAARGEIVVQGDADTVYPRDWLKRIAEHLADPRVVAVTGAFSYREPVGWAGVERGLRNVANALSCIVLRRPAIISGANFAFRKEAFIGCKGYDRRLFAPDQYGIATQLSRFGKVVYDRSLTAATSARRVNKPFSTIMMDFAANVACGSSRILLRHVESKLPADRKALLRYAFVLPLLAAIPVSVVGYFVPSSTVFGRVYSSAKTQDKVIALSFDGGPSEPYTSEILNILDSQGIHATFFVTGEGAQLHPQTVRRMLADGDVVGNHSYSHNASHALTGKGIRDMRRGQRAIYAVAGVEPHFYRPPEGTKSPWELYAVKHDGLSEVNWSIGGSDLDTGDPAAFAQQIVRKARPGGIIDMNDSYGSDGHGSSHGSLTVEALPIIIKSLQDQGYSFVTVAQLLGQPAYKVGS